MSGVSFTITIIYQIFFLVLYCMLGCKTAKMFVQSMFVQSDEHLSVIPENIHTPPTVGTGNSKREEGQFSSLFV